jgi:hypothetical protein
MNKRMPGPYFCSPLLGSSCAAGWPRNSAAARTAASCRLAFSARWARHCVRHAAPCTGPAPKPSTSGRGTWRGRFKAPSAPSPRSRHGCDRSLGRMARPGWSDGGCASRQHWRMDRPSWNDLGCASRQVWPQARIVRNAGIYSVHGQCFLLLLLFSCSIFTASMWGPNAVGSFFPDSHFESLPVIPLTGPQQCMRLVAGILCGPSKRLSLAKANLQSCSPNDPGAAFPTITESNRIPLVLIWHAE